MTDKEAAFLNDLAAVLKKHEARIEKRVWMTGDEYDENWSFEGEGIVIEMDDAMDAVTAINEVQRREPTQEEIDEFVEDIWPDAEAKAELAEKYRKDR